MVAIRKSNTSVTLARSASKSATDPTNQRAAHTTAQAPAPAKPGNGQAAVAASPIRPRTFPDNAVIRVISGANPKRPGTKAASKWALYSGAKTVGDLVAAFVKAGYPRRRAMSALRWDSGHGFIEVTVPGASK